MYGPLAPACVLVTPSRLVVRQCTTSHAAGVGLVVDGVLDRRLVERPTCAAGHCISALLLGSVRTALTCYTACMHRAAAMCVVCAHGMSGLSGCVRAHAGAHGARARIGWRSPASRRAHHVPPGCRRRQHHNCRHMCRSHDLQHGGGVGPQLDAVARGSVMQPAPQSGRASHMAVRPWPRLMAC